MPITDVLKKYPETDPAQIFLTPDEKALLYAMADRLHAFFIKYNIDYRICANTALGAFKERGIIRSDDSIKLMLHPENMEQFKHHIEDNTFILETGVSIEKSINGEWQCFYSDNSKEQPNPSAKYTGKPFVSIFPGTLRLVGDKEIITYDRNKMHSQSKTSHFSTQEWGTPTLYHYGPTKLFGVEPGAMKDYLQRCYGSTALNYRTRIQLHEVYSLWSPPSSIPHATPDALDFSHTLYNKKRSLSKLSFEETRIWVDGIFDLFHQGHQNILKNAIESTQIKYKPYKIVLLIGVCGDDEDVIAYKRKPIMSLAERCNAIEAFMKELVKKYPNVSYQVVPDSPITLALEFIQKHQLNILFHGSDFTEEKIRTYYGVILEQCAETCSFEILPYTPGVSTTELIRLLQNDGNFGDTSNTTLIKLEELVIRAKQRWENQLTHSALTPT